jgi:biopolymer transport protein ExbD
MEFKTKLKTSHQLIDLTPLVDVIFLMLIFFIITSDILPLKSLHVENPKLNRDSSPLTTQLLVVMDAQNVIYVGSKKAIVDLAS